MSLAGTRIAPLLSVLATLPLLQSGAASQPQPVDLVPPERHVETGRITGTVDVSSALAARRPRFRIYADAGQGAVPPSHAGDDLARELQNVVIYVERGPTGLSETADSASVMSQANERFEPHVLPVVRGARVAFPNRDDVYHNVFSLSSTRTFDLGRYPKGEAKSVTFGKTGVVQVFCHIHSDMSAIILVLPNAHFDSPDASGRYSIDDLPAGEYTLVGWHERTRPVTRSIRVVAGQTTAVNFSLPLDTRGTP